MIESETDAQLCAEMLAEVFAEQNPLSICMGTTAESLLHHWLWPLVADSFRENLSFFIRDSTSNNIAAVLIANDLYHYCEKHSYEPSTVSSANPLNDFFIETRHHFVEHEFKEPLTKNLVLNITAGGTRSSHSSRGLAAKLRTFVCHYARDHRGYRYAFIQASHPATRYIYLKKLHGIITGTFHPQQWFLTKNIYDPSSPMKNYQGAPMDNILVQLEEMDKEKQMD